MDSIHNVKYLIQKHNTVSSEGVGLLQSPSKYWYAFAYMLHLSTNEELEQMTHDESPALRIYSYAGLIYNKYSNLKNIKKRLHTDKESVNTFFGCISNKEMDVANCTKQFIKNYHENSIASILSILKNDEKYRNQLYDDLMNDRKIQRIPE